jgi:dCTP diphosphatase
MPAKPIDLEKILAHQRTFVRDRDWEKFHTPKNLAMALSGEAGELVELFQWLTAEESTQITQNPDKATALRHELADVFFYLLRLTDHFGIDLEAALWEKFEQNAKKYPVELSRGHAKKYTEL